MKTTNLLSKLIKSNQLETISGLNQALECIGLEQQNSELTLNKAIEVRNVILEKFTDLIDVQSIVESIKERISIEELEELKNEITIKLNQSIPHSAKAPMYQKRLTALKCCLEEVAGDSVL